MLDILPAPALPIVATAAAWIPKAAGSAGRSIPGREVRALPLAASVAAWAMGRSG